MWTWPLPDTHQPMEVPVARQWLERGQGALGSGGSANGTGAEGATAGVARSKILVVDATALPEL